ncbi:Uncharacterised protein [Mycobacteroides abscessus subsp. abscessus]|nr:Uncharacterised protein [Mycobacteroides abscessus subsp. abscessus]
MITVCPMVIRLKRAWSSGSRQGMAPSAPMTPARVCAQISPMVPVIPRPAP